MKFFQHHSDNPGLKHTFPDLKTHYVQTVRPGSLLSSEKHKAGEMQQELWFSEN